jgi:NADH-quinone oxidoreductase subunit N
MNYLGLLQFAAAETILVATALALLAADLLGMRGLETRFRFTIGAMITCVGCLAAVAWLAVFQKSGDPFGGMLVSDKATNFIKISLLVLTIFTVLLSTHSRFTDHVGEYLALILLATIGMMFLASAEDILMIFIALELTSLSLYILTAFSKRSIQSAEAALKYFLFGGISAAFTLFGLSLVYGVSGATHLREIAIAIGGKGLDPLLVIALIMVVIGFGFKVAAVPFHLWAPDAYEGAPAPTAALIASGSKVASFFVFAKVMALGFEGVEGSGAWRHFASGWVPVIAVVATLSMILGNLAAIVQSSVRRLLAYSAVAHAGYVLIALLAHDEQALASIVYYVITYGLTTIGAFGVVNVVEQGTGGDKLANFVGLSRRAPVVALCMMVFMLSLAGIPPLAGFFGKFYLFAAAVKTGAPNLGLLWLVILAIAMSAVSLYYYLQVLKQIYVADVASDGSRWKVPALDLAVLCLLAASVVVLGCAPSLILNLLQ